jgi:hypothetical protein
VIGSGTNSLVFMGPGGRGDLAVTVSVLRNQLPGAHGEGGGLISLVTVSVLRNQFPGAHGEGGVTVSVLRNQLPGAHGVHPPPGW